MLAPSWLCLIFSHAVWASGSDSSLKVEECDNNVCSNVNLSHSVVIVRSEDKNGKTSVLFKDDIEHTLATLFWERRSKNLKLGLNPYVGQDVFEYSSVPTFSNDNFYDCSIAIQNDQLKVFFDGYPTAAWDFSNLVQGMSEENKTIMSENVDLDFTSVGDKILISERCSEGYHIDIVDKTCSICSTEHSVYGTGMTKMCTDLESMMDFCGSTVCSAEGFCPSSKSSSPYGDFAWPASLVSSKPQHFDCQYDSQSSGLKARRTCSANNTWTELDTTDCVKTKMTDSLSSLVGSSSSDEQVRRHLLKSLQDSKNIGRQDILLSYDIINKVIKSGQGGISYETGMDVIKALTYIAEGESCKDNPSCFWMIELLRGVVPRLNNQTVLMLSGSIGMFYLRTIDDVLDVYTFCQHTFQHMITGCASDQLSFLKVMQNELVRLLDGETTNNITLSLIFSNDITFYPTVRVLTAKQFNETVRNFTLGEDEGAQAIATMVVDVKVTGLPSDTKTHLFFALYNTAIYKTKERMFTSNGTSYEIKYECVYYQTNSTRDKYLAARGTTWDPDVSVISGDGIVDVKGIVTNRSRLGAWESDGCETSFDRSADNPAIRCRCGRTSGAFTVLVRITKKEFPEYYVEILISLTCVCLLGIGMGLLIIFIPPKWMGIPKTAKINIAVIMMLLVVALYFLLNKMTYEFHNFKF